ncbi:MAG: beta-N-acetylhexosaminidase [Chromatiales bacterium]|nr:beta-N-acetylhexosaminidase [Chromatiales bacterium]
MSIGPVMVGVEGLELSAEERELLGHPAVGGVILFSRNYESPEQVQALVDAVHGCRTPRPIVGVDQEGGRVQRLREPFTVLPAAAALGRLHDREPALATAVAEHLGRLLALELRAVGIDLSFAPVLDLGRPRASVVGERALHRDPDVVSRLARAELKGMRDAGLAAVGKHFPGHGGVEVDSHHDLPVDPRPLAELRRADLVPFVRLAQSGLPAMMPAHVLFPAVDDRPVGYSPVWLRDILRGQLGFQGVIFSDDLGMAAAAGAGAYPDRAVAALEAGCDMVLACNELALRGAVAQACERFAVDAVRSARLVRLHGRRGVSSWQALITSPERAALAAELARLDPAPELDLRDDSPA